MGHVARGGIRWSDRREDFRTEVLGLMKAQNVKNTLIVPVGAKGGFVPKRLAAGASREDAQREGVECYRTFIRGLLDLTDNIVDGKIVTAGAGRASRWRRCVPGRRRRQRHRQLLRHRQPHRRRIPASGSAMRLPRAARRATTTRRWRSPRAAHGNASSVTFREIGIDTQSQDFTVAGIGDMAGDVFGNGMLLSQHIRLVAAFNHQHIFIDPTPDAARSFAERERLFQLPRSTWDDYNRKLLSKGGGIYPRSAKSIKLSPQAQALLGLKRDSITPQELIRAILTMQVDLLWNGGIGTYVKAERAKVIWKSAIAPTMRCASTARNCAARSSAKAATSASRNAAASSTHSTAVASTPTSSTTPPASTAPTTK